ncbi:acyl-CoA dehydratase activase [Clostridium bowmanii]|uniref:acyl-CoA dehydratase activase n=1 Tax=Clostridium bowmanii TaxID=132925 RepID=UPI001C0CD703|nr:acyl-CoA dehydratase activase [Clostridium bowmanii]MBU3191417.1 2-hydroxyglutaryl-CoA dehydratase [Clostridium bowmanii]MCA1075595.1 acyl-CoA dehydratase activase [Clostridium bowmanii]
MRVLGIDLGSRAVKIVLMEDNKIIHSMKVSTMNFYKNYCDFNGKVIVNLEKLHIGQINNAVSTGYGKNNTDLLLFTPINELKAHVYGGFYQTGLKDFILLDVGGQDVKVVKVEKGIITDLELNEKCAASCGRYLENMAHVLEVSLQDMSLHYKNPVELNSTCAVFSESELIGKIAEGVSIENLCSSVNYSLYKRLKPLLSKFKDKKLILTGGVANNTAIKEFLRQDYEDIVSIKEPQFNGAIGCCYYGSTFL